MVAPERVWTPWRMTYLTGDVTDEGCVFCSRLADSDDVASLIVHRGERTFVIMNLYPYGSGHVMILPNAHTASPVDLDAATRHEMADMLPAVMTIMERVFGCEGFNSGLNLGIAGGAGIAEHLHQHVVPRWIGDANFFPIIASTKAIPELLPSQYAKLRLEFEQETIGAMPVTVIALTDHDSRILMIDDDLPEVTPAEPTAIWRTAIDVLQNQMSAIEVAGWGGARRCGHRDPSAIVLRGVATQSATLVPIDELPPSLQGSVRTAIAGLAPIS